MNNHKQNNINGDPKMQDGGMKDCGDDCEQPNNTSRHNVVKDDFTEGVNTCEQNNTKCDRVGVGRI